MADKIATSTFDALRHLANRWTLKARDFARDAKTDNPADPIAAYHRGLAEGYYKAAVELAEILKEQQTQPAPSTPAPAPKPAPKPAPPKAAAAPPPPAPPAETYLPVPYNEAVQILEYSGTNPRDVTVNKQNVFTAVFSKWENLMPHERIELLKKADMRIVVLSSGKTKDTNDPYVEFAFKDVEIAPGSEEPSS
jgi:hypothetical protein